MTKLSVDRCLLVLLRGICKLIYASCVGCNKLLVEIVPTNVIRDQDNQLYVPICVNDFQRKIWPGYKVHRQIMTNY